eukprot:TRINITY_DN13346_c0_g1_i1.p2 TRINITY_DN13346_c0_g1~~TRINITY_DN13346_c0_g1_i1.p2  ORF type:complete len:240 (-),score=44.18 TRINITY_DN13346_c0_g1_i1:815-1534(-)
MALSKKDIRQKILASQSAAKERNDPGNKMYLFAYNIAEAAGWLALLLSLAKHYLTGGAPDELYPAVASLLQLFQTLAAMEIVHAVFGLVRSSAMTVTMQVFSRLWITWAILWSVKEAQESLFLTGLIFCWSFTEVFRYSYYALSIYDYAPFWLKYLRYTTFLPLYPAGVACELGLMWVSLPVIQATQLYRFALPNMLNFPFNFYVVNVIGMLLYVPGLPFLFKHMMVQRNRQLAPPKSS